VLALLAVASGCGPAGPQVLLVSVDTLRADRLGAYGDTRGLTPHLDRLAAESVVFENAYAPAPFTLPSVTALLTGRHPEEAGVRTNAAVVADALPTLAEWLGQRGWWTGGLVGNFVLRARTGLARGFDHYDDRFAPRKDAAPERTAEELSDAALALLAQRDPGTPAFLWVHYQDPHGPYTPPPGYRGPLIQAERERPEGLRALPLAENDRGMGGIPPYQYDGSHRQVAYYRAGYAAEIRYADEQIGRLLAETRPGGRLAGALVVFTADHGEALGERDQWFAHGELLSDAVLHVPLLVRVPGREPERRRDLASLLDVVPTLAGLLSIPAPRGARGRDLFAEGAADASVALYATSLLESTRPRRALIAGARRLELALEPGGVPRPALYRRGDDAEDLADQEPERVRRLARRLRELRDGLEVRPPQAPRLSAEEREALRRLGYAP
jgi:arylsulfatase